MVGSGSTPSTPAANSSGQRASTSAAAAPITTTATSGGATASSVAGGAVAGLTGTGAVPGPGASCGGLFGAVSGGHGLGGFNSGPISTGQFGLLAMGRLELEWLRRQ
ncbi:unnamed protein product [Phytophthora fragariaefolia]|uniref:Unnamed protein product n=1 Tax=Phytophthora fragariaefolia TaxID=1490495 RepID=A0A9W6TQE8_9STRA|nr:unnamed protein product [Phytophthora fragariaefolia]